jgi:hypothetical protein
MYQRRRGGNVEIVPGDFEGLGKRRETAVWFSSFSMARHFHGAPRFPCAFSLLAKSEEELPLGLLALVSPTRCRFAWSRPAPIPRCGILLCDRHSFPARRPITGARFPKVWRKGDIHISLCRARLRSALVVGKVGGSSDTDGTRLGRTDRCLRQVPRRGSLTRVLADHRTVLGFHQTVVVARPRPRFGLLNQQSFEQPTHRFVDKFPTVVRVKTPDAKRKLPQNSP